MAAIPPEDSLAPEIHRLRMLHQAIGAQLRHVENLQSMANQELIANQQTRPTPPPHGESSPSIANEAIAATLQGNPAIGMTWASLCKPNMHGHPDAPLH